MKATPEIKICDICIIGAGTAGIAAAYATLERYSNVADLKVILVDKNSAIGGTAVQGWVQTWIEGINPPYLKDILRGGFKFSDTRIENSTLPKKYCKDGYSGGNLNLDRAELHEVYNQDLLTGGVEILCSYSFDQVISYSDGVIETIIVKNISNQEEKSITAKVFIDASGDGVLCRAISDVSYYVGEDPRSRFKEDLMPEADDVYDSTCLNEPSLFFKLESTKGLDDSTILNDITTVYKTEENEIIKPSYIKKDGYVNTSFCNPMTGLGYSGYDCLDNVDNAYNECKKRFLEYWKYVKLNLEPLTSNETFGAFKAYIKDWNYNNEFASMLGIRESYRIKCEYMLNQSDLLKPIIGNPDLADYIACGSHIVDFHVYKNIKRSDVNTFNEKICPSGIPFRCMVPIGLNNTLIACRAYGASHIALAARRVNKDMAQLGWAAGHAAVIRIQKSLSDFRVFCQGSVENNDSQYIKHLQEVTKFAENVNALSAIANSKYTYNIQDEHEE